MVWREFGRCDVAHVEDGLTTLVGWTADQSGLHGTIPLLRDLNIELVSVNPDPDA